MKKITIFTPTYNRRNLLGRLYESLKAQTNKNFIWLVVDDGSSDNTEEVINEYKKEKVVDIQYFYKENGGKHSAIDFAHENCKTPYIACVDSDDYLTENAIEELEELIKEVDDKDDCVGIVMRRANIDLKPFSDKWPEKDGWLYFNELANKYDYTKDTFLIFKTEIVRKFHFPKVEGERFVTEKVLYNQFMFDYEMYASSKLIYIGEYQEGGYTAGALKLLFKNPKSCLYAFKSDSYYFTKYKINLNETILAWGRFYVWRRLNKFKNLYKEEFKIKSFKKFLGWMFSLVLYFRYKKKQRIFKNGL